MHFVIVLISFAESTDLSFVLLMDFDTFIVKIFNFGNFEGVMEYGTFWAKYNRLGNFGLGSIMVGNFCLGKFLVVYHYIGHFSGNIKF